MTSRTLPFARATELLTVVGRDGTIESAAPRLAGVLGAERADLVGVSIFELTSEADRRHLEERWRALGSKGAPWAVEVWMSWRGTVPRRLVWELVLDEEAGVVLATVHEARKLEAWYQARRRELLLSTITEKAPIVAWVADADGRLLEVVGQRSAEPGARAKDLYQDSPEMVAAIQRGLAGTDSFERHRNGHATLDTWLVPLTQGSADEALVGVSIDVTREEEARWQITHLLDRVEHQQIAMASMLSVILPVWDGVLCLPVGGVVDSERAQRLLECTLDAIVAHRASYVIMDITGVEHVDTSSADGLWSITHSVRLLGARMIMTGVQPSVAQTMAMIGVNMDDVLTFTTLQGALRYCIRHTARRSG